MFSFRVQREANVDLLPVFNTSGAYWIALKIIFKTLTELDGLEEDKLVLF